MCRKSYIHPAILDSYLDGSLLEFLKGQVEATLREELEGLSGEEAAVLAFLQQRLSRRSTGARRTANPRSEDRVASLGSGIRIGGSAR